MSIYTFSNYKLFLKDYMRKKPRQGHGEISKMAKALNIHTTLMSMVLSRERDLTPEQTFDLCRYLELTELEADYLTLLVQIARAGSNSLREHLKRKLKAVKD